MQTDAWGRVQSELQKEISENNYVTWIKPLRLADLDAGVARFEVPNGFVGTWVRRNFGDRIIHLFRASGSRVDRLEFDVTVPRSPAANSTAGAPAQQVGQAPMGRLAPEADEGGSPLDPRLTFESFVVGKPNELAHAAARRVAEGGPVSFNPLFL